MGPAAAAGEGSDRAGVAAGTADEAIIGIVLVDAAAGIGVAAADGSVVDRAGVDEGVTVTKTVLVDDGVARSGKFCDASGGASKIDDVVLEVDDEATAEEGVMAPCPRIIDEPLDKVDVNTSPVMAADDVDEVALDTTTDVVEVVEAALWTVCDDTIVSELLVEIGILPTPAVMLATVNTSGVAVVAAADPNGNAGAVLLESVAIAAEEKVLAAATELLEIVRMPGPRVIDAVVKLEAIGSEELGDAVTKAAVVEDAEEVVELKKLVVLESTDTKFGVESTVEEETADSTREALVPAVETPVVSARLLLVTALESVLVAESGSDMVSETVGSESRTIDVLERPSLARILRSCGLCMIGLDTRQSKYEMIYQGLTSIHGIPF